MKYIDAERLRKEVKGLERAAHKSALGCADSETRKFHEGKDFAYQHVGILIDSIQQEQPDFPPINPDDAMKKLDEKIALVKQRRTWDGVDVDKYMDEVRGRVSDDLEEAARDYTWDDYGIIYEGERVNGYIIDHVKDAFIAGAKWQEEKDQETIKLAEDHAFLAGAVNEREKMMKEAVEGEVTKDNRGNNVLRVGLLNNGFEIGDKVRIIIINQDKK